ncbi:replication factor A subunit protein RFA1 NDAI_0J01860 [Naumovozyma dairenensis CBS 421]|uniref:Replication protein A subunit n=1 Tax=Naumovozyma dairenensis (strain ATCC 10597 / BCRC 20456 / CBS 421 / NBRC 0211 / NRRL Y-12639) TaxID=1071378 RepID=G0WH00_NAUDC|nr:hypothetical protein NDAI_0J01860 [Naumovozyma dairenensis CBS 421]CCD27078.1 hypothetical protein NDAI_0J01860 [Naumovozyma dairenensis CBS 421]
MSNFELSKGDLYKLFTDQERYDNSSGGVYQVFNVRKADASGAKKKPLIMITDGVYHMKSLLRGSAATKFQLQRGDIIRVTAGEANYFPQRNKYALAIDDFELVETGVELVNRASKFLDAYFNEHPNERLIVPSSNIENTTTDATSANNATEQNPSQQQQQQQQQRKQSNFPSSHSQKSKPIFAIEQLSPYQNIWTIKARVSYKGEIKKWHNQRGDGSLFNVNFLDTSGEIRATAFNENAEKFSEILQEGKVYYVSKARLQPAKPQFTNLTHPYELNLDRDTVIEECFDEDNVPKTHFNFIKLDAIPNQENNTNVDVLGVIQTVNPHFELTSRAGKRFDRRDISIVDESGFEISVGLWNQQAIDFNLPEGSVVAIKGVRVSDFGGKSLSMGFNSTLVPNPEIPEAYSLKGWYDSTGRNGNFTSLKQEAGSNNISSANQEKFISQRITITRAQAENLGKSEKGDYFSVKAAISFLKVDNFAYPACSNENCNKKVIEQPDGTWRCEKCETNNEAPQWRYMLTISVMDETNQLWLTLFNDQAEQLLDIDANKLIALKENDPEEFTKITQSIQMNQYDFRIRAREDSYNDQTRIRYTVANLHKLNYKGEADYLATRLSNALLA